MSRLLTLLFLSFLCTGVRAQKTETPQTMGSGSLLVDVTTNTREIVVSSATYHKRYRYVSEELYRRRPEQYRDYEVFYPAGPEDLSMVHAIVNDLIKRGWRLTETDYNMDVENNDDEDFQVGTYVVQKLYFQFEVPMDTVATATAGGVVKLKAEVKESDLPDIRGELLSNPDGTYTLLLQEWFGNRWLDRLRITDEGPVVKDKAPLIEALRLSKDHLEIAVKLDNGTYRYGFSEDLDRNYIFSDLVFQATENCGVVAYRATWRGTPEANVRGRYRAEPCEAEGKDKPFFSEVRVNRLPLRDFVPGNQLLLLETVDRTVTF